MQCGAREGGGGHHLNHLLEYRLTETINNAFLKLTNLKYIYFLQTKRRLLLFPAAHFATTNLKWSHLVRGRSRVKLAQNLNLVWKFNLRLLNLAHCVKTWDVVLEHIEVLPNLTHTHTFVWWGKDIASTLFGRVAKLLFPAIMETWDLWRSS